MIEVKVFLGLHICLRLSAHLFLVFLKRVKESVLNSVLQYILNSGEYNLYSYSYSFSFHGRNLSFILLKSLHNARNLSEIQDTVLIKIYKNVLKYFPLIPQAYNLRSRSKYNFCLSVCLSISSPLLLLLWYTRGFLYDFKISLFCKREPCKINV